MLIRNAQRGDIPGITDLISLFYAESGYNAPPVDRERAGIVLDAYVDRVETDYQHVFCQVMDDDGAIVGVTIGERIDDLWSELPKAVEIIMYAKREYRGRPSAGRMLRNFADWAHAEPAMVRVEASSGITDSMASQVFTKLGWKQRGTLYGTEVY